MIIKTKLGESHDVISSGFGTGWILKKAGAYIYAKTGFQSNNGFSLAILTASDWLEIFESQFLMMFASEIAFGAFISYSMEILGPRLV